MMTQNLYPNHLKKNNTKIFRVSIIYARHLKHAEAKVPACFKFQKFQKFQKIKTTQNPFVSFLLYSKLHQEA